MANNEGKLQKSKTKPFLKLTKEFFYSSQIRKMENALGMESSWYEMNLLKLEFHLVTECNEQGLEGFFPNEAEAIDQLEFDIHFSSDNGISFKAMLDVLISHGLIEQKELEGRGYLFFPRIVENQMTINKRKEDCRKGGLESANSRRQKKEDGREFFTPNIEQVEGYLSKVFPGMNPTEIDLYSDSFFQEQERNGWKENWRESLSSYVASQKALCPA